MQRYFCKEKQKNNFILSNDDYYHITKVMRMKTNDKIEIVYNKNVYECLLEISENISITPIKTIESNDDEKEITLIVPLLKEQKMDIVLQKSTELGVNKIIPLITERSIVKDIDEEKKIIRWTKICKEASEQSKRNVIPIVTNIKHINDLHIDGVKLVCSTNEKKENLKMFLQSQNIYDTINIVVGPEGGLSSKEEQQLNELGFKSVTLGKRIMRVETVPIFILSILNYEFME